MKKQKRSLEKEEQALMEELKKTKIALESAYSNFENVVDPDLIDCYIYEVNAVQHRYKFLLRQVKELNNHLLDLYPEKI
jgi:hypothetical protein